MMGNIKTSSTECTVGDVVQLQEYFVNARRVRVSRVRVIAVRVSRVRVRNQAHSEISMELDALLKELDAA